MQTAAERWKEAREAAGLSAAVAADLSRIHKNTIYDLERGDEGVTLRVMNRVAAIYGVSLGTIFSDPSAERVPMDLRPLHDILQPLDMEARISFVRNVVSNAKFMGQLIAIREVEVTKNPVPAGYTATPKSNGTDNPSDAAMLGDGGASARSANAPHSAKPEAHDNPKHSSKKARYR